MNIKELNYRFQNILNEQIEKDIMGSYNIVLPNSNAGISITLNATSNIDRSTISISSFSKGNQIKTFQSEEQVSKQEAEKRAKELANILNYYFEKMGTAYEQFLNKYNYKN